MSKDIKYQEALKTLDELIAEIENDDIDVDDLGARIKEAVNLLRACKAKIDKADLEVKKVIEDFS